MRRAEEIVSREIRPTRAEIDLDAIAQNARELAESTGARVFGVVKADAYGHGAIPVARALVEHGQVAGLMVSLVEEGIELRRAGIGGDMLVMGGVYAGGHRDVLQHGLVPVVSDPRDLELFGRAAGSGRARVHLKLDTGMARLGVRAEDAAAVLDALPGNVDVVGICTHLAQADDPDPAPTRAQLARFDAALAQLRARGLRPDMIHAANSAAALRFPEARYDAVRPGLALYGGLGELGAPGHQAMRLVTGVSQTRRLAVGESVSYGALWRASRPSRVATLPIGYADGYPRRLSNHAEVLMRGRRCPVVGAVCMDMTIVDVTDLPDDVQPGEEAVLLGAQGGERITAAELAGQAGLIEYEITCGVSKRVPRTYRSRSP